MRTSWKLAGFAVVPAATVTIAGLASAETRIDRRQERQEERIDQGIRSGQLTPHEARVLERGQARVDRMEDRALSDGQLSPKDRLRIEHEQNVQSRRIFRQKHDRGTK